MIKKRTLSFVLLLMAHLGMSAAYSLVIHRSGGQDDAFLLENKPVVTFDDANLNVDFEGALFAIPCNDIKNMEFIDDYVGIDKVGAMTDMVEVIDANTFRFNIADNSVIRVYDISGRHAGEASVKSDGEFTTVNVARCDAGVYVIAYKNKSFKIVKK